jgi:hypothetical protein
LLYRVYDDFLNVRIFLIGHLLLDRVPSTYLPIAAFGRHQGSAVPI